MFHIICAVIDTEWDSLTPVGRINRLLHFVHSLCNQKHNPDYVVLCPTKKGKFFDDHEPHIRRLLQQAGIKFFISDELGRESDLKAFKKSFDFMNETIGEQAMEASWLSLFLYPQELHPDFCKVVRDAIDDDLYDKNEGVETQVIVLNKTIAGNPNNYGNIYESVIQGKIARAFFSTHMYRSLSDQPTPFWILTLLIWVRIPLFPGGAHRYVEWEHKHDIMMLNPKDEVVYNKQKCLIEAIDGQPNITFTRSSTTKDNVYTVKLPSLDGYTDDGVTIELKRSEFKVEQEVRSCVRLLELQNRSNKIRSKHLIKHLPHEKLTSILYRTEICILTGMAIGALAKQQEIAIRAMGDHIREHSPDLLEETIEKLAVWAQEQGPFVSSELLNIPVPDIDSVLDDKSVPICKELLMEDGDTMRPFKKADIVKTVLMGMGKCNIEQIQEAARVIEIYANIFAKSLAVNIF